MISLTPVVVNDLVGPSLAMHAGVNHPPILVVPSITKAMEQMIERVTLVQGPAHHDCDESDDGGVVFGGVGCRESLVQTGSGCGFCVG